MRALLAAAIAVLAFMCGGPAAASAAPGGDYYGATIQPMFSFLPSSCTAAPVCWDTILDRMSTDGLGTARMAVQWSELEPHPPTNGRHSYWWDGDWDPANMDRVVAMLADHGQRLVPVLAATPPWAMTPGTTQLSPDHYADYAAFVGAFAARYGSDGTFWAAHPMLPRLPITDYEIWTEANSTESWSLGPDPAAYAQGLALVHQAVHAADPAARVLASLGWQDFAGYLTAMYANGAGGNFDGIAFHPYAPHGPAIVDLVRTLRATLVALGDPALPIDVTEVGQPAAPSGPGATQGGDGGRPVSDQARAATQTFAGDVLARSDCGVENYILYAAVSSGTEVERLHEGFMNLYGSADALPNATGAAIAAASQRWRGAPSGGLVVCGAGTTAAPALLPLALEVSAPNGGCVLTRVTYEGNPLEGVTVTARPNAGGETRGTSNAFGGTVVCGSAPASSMTVTAQVPNLAAAPAAQVVIPRPVPRNTARPCTYHLNGRIVRVSPRSGRFKARLVCGTTTFARTRLAVGLRRKGRRQVLAMRHMTVRANRWLSFNVRAKLHPGDRIVVTHAAEKRRVIPKLTKVITLTSRSPGLRRGSRPRSA